MTERIQNPFEQFGSISENERLDRVEVFESQPEDERAEEIERAHVQALRERGESFDEALDKLEDEDFKRDLILARIISERIAEKGGRALAVGGFVRDLCLRRFGYGAASKDIDLEVYGIDNDELKKFLQEIVDDPKVQIATGMKAGIVVGEVGKSFGVIAILGLDISSPRRDVKTEQGEGRKPDVEIDVEMSPEQASMRRDLTINSLAMDPLTGQILDYYGGLNDAQNKVLRHIYLDNPSDSQFGEDPLRVLRVMQFAGRFDFEVAPETAEICKSTNLSSLPKERVGKEWNKLLLQSARPSVGLEVAKDIRVIEKLHSELAEEMQDEGKWESRLAGLDQLSALSRRDSLPLVQRKRLMLASLGGVFTAEKDFKKFLVQVDTSKDDQKAILLFGELLNGFNDLTENETDKDRDYKIRKMAFELGKAKLGLSMNDMYYLAWSEKVALDNNQQDRKLQLRFEEGEDLLNRAQELGVKDGPLKPVVTGDDLKDLGLKQGAVLGKMLREVFEKQMHGEFDNESLEPQKDMAMEWVQSRID